MKKLIGTVLFLVFFFSLASCRGDILTHAAGATGTNPSVTQSGKQDKPNSEMQSLSSVNNVAKTLTISVCWDHYEIDKAVELFKKIHPDVEITVNNYKNDDKKYKSQIVTNIMAGSPDDIVDGTGLPYIKLAESRLLTDIYSLMNNDKDFNKDNYYTNVFEAFNYKNQLYIFPVIFAYHSIGVNNTIDSKLVSKYSKYETITDSNLLSLYNETENKNGYYIGENFNPLNVITTNLDKFIDYENKNSNFNSDEFIRLVTDSKNAMERDKKKSGSQVSYGLGLEKEALNAKKYLFNETSTGSYCYFLPYKEFNSFTHYIPKANQEGKVYIYPSMRFCISEKSKNKELAWEFLKFLTLPETNELISFGNMFSINKETFKAKTTSAMEGYIKDIESQNNIYLEGDIHGYIENAIAYFDQCNQLPMIYNDLESYLEIIMNDMDMLDKGLMTPEQLASDLQNKISLLLME